MKGVEEERFQTIYDNVHPLLRFFQLCHVVIASSTELKVLHLILAQELSSKNLCLVETLQEIIRSKAPTNAVKAVNLEASHRINSLTLQFHLVTL